MRIITPKGQITLCNNMCKCVFGNYFDLQDQIKQEHKFNKISPITLVYLRGCLCIQLYNMSKWHYCATLMKSTLLNKN